MSADEILTGFLELEGAVRASDQFSLIQQEIPAHLRIPLPGTREIPSWTTVWLYGFSRTACRFTALRCSKGQVAAVPSARAVRGYDSEMIRGAATQPSGVRTNTLVPVRGLSIGGSRESVAGRCSILKMHTRRQSVRINRAVQCG